MLNAGAIPLVRGNCGMLYHTINLVFGEAKNPQRPARSCAGSSGGDAGLISAGCIPFSFGTDIGGSTRFPAAFCGIYGLKPTTKRVPTAGLPAPIGELRFCSAKHMDTSIGPMGTSVDDLITAMEVLADPKVNYYDPFCAPVKWDSSKIEQVLDPANAKNIKIGILRESSFMPVSLSTTRAIKMTEDALKEFGCQVEEVSFSSDVFMEASDIYMGVLANTSGPAHYEALLEECETLVKPLEGLGLILNSGWTFRKFLDFLLVHVMNQGRTQRALTALQRLGPKELEEFLKHRYEFVYKIAEEWRNKGLTALVCPIFPTCALKHATMMELGALDKYAQFVNVTGFSAGAIPVTRVKADEQVFDDGYNDHWTKYLKEDLKDAEGMPVAVQVVGYAYEDEVVLGLMKVIASKVGFKSEIPESKFESEITNE